VSHPLLRRSYCVALSLVFLLAGCDSRPRRVPVSGQVLIDGQPVTAGSIQVVPDDARPAQGTIDEQGHFTLTTYEQGDGCVPGTHRVAVSATEMIGGDQVRYLVPQKYADFSSSGLTVTIDGPTDDLRIELSWEGERPTIMGAGAEGDIDPSVM
jgi:hypothetical protein